MGGTNDHSWNLRLPGSRSPGLTGRAEWGAEDVLSRPLLNGERFHCIKDLVFHVTSVEDFWIQEEILREQPVRKTIPALKDTQGGPSYAGFAIDTLLNYWQIVEQSTLRYLATLTD